MFDIKARAKPVLKWAGGKSGPLRQLFEHFPKKFDRYLEPFIGGGAVFFCLKKGTPALINDTNPELANLYQSLRVDCRGVMDSLESLRQKYSEEFYYELRMNVPESNIDRAARTIFLNKSGFNGLYRLNSKGEFNVPFGKRTKCPSLYDPENLLAVSERLNGAEILNCDFEEILNRAGTGDFVYCDPPYEPLSSTSSFNSYTARGFSRQEQQRLFEACRNAVKRGATVAISNSTAPFIVELYEGSQLHYITARRAINSKGEKRGEIHEVLAILRPEAEMGI